jgi:predicted dinucleotide-binding enzyme
VAKKKIISLLGGTGDLGTGLASRLLNSGYKVIIGSRSKSRSKISCSSQKGNYLLFNTETITFA